MFISSEVFRTTALGLVRLAKLYRIERPLCLQNYESNAPTELVESFIQLCCSKVICTLSLHNAVRSAGMKQGGRLYWKALYMVCIRLNCVQSSA